MPFLKGFRRHFGPILPIFPIGAGIFSPRFAPITSRGGLICQRGGGNSAGKGARPVSGLDSFTVRTLDRRGFTSTDSGKMSARRVSGSPGFPCRIASPQPGRGDFRGDCRKRRRRSSGKEAGGFQFVRVWIIGKAAAVAPGLPFGGIRGKSARPALDRFAGAFSSPPINSGKMPAASIFNRRREKKSGRPSPRSLPHKTNILSEGMVYIPPLQRGRLTSAYRKTFRRTYEGLRLSPPRPSRFAPVAV